MPPLETYSRDLPYSYALGVYPSIECVKRHPQSTRRLLIHSQADKSGGILELINMCETSGIRIETADRLLRSISRKENCFAAAVFDKPNTPIDRECSHVVLVNPSDQGNLGTILRSLAAFGMYDLAIIEPAADVYDPHVVRASMGALFAMRISSFDSYDMYRLACPDHARYPFMLDASTPLPEIHGKIQKPYALIFGSEGPGLPASFAGEGIPIRIPQTNDVDSLNLAVSVSIAAYTFYSDAYNWG